MKNKIKNIISISTFITLGAIFILVYLFPNPITGLLLFISIIGGIYILQYISNLHENNLEKKTMKDL
jgi:hypothetical protein